MDIFVLKRIRDVFEYYRKYLQLNDE